jgi:hypothetical protein
VTAAKPPGPLSEARRRDSSRKRARVAAVVDQMTAAGEPVTFPEVRRRSGVSSWLVYAPGVREHIDKARARQELQPTRDRQAGSAASLRTDLELARAAGRELRRERDQLKAALQRALGHQLDDAENAGLAARVAELTQACQRLTGERDQTRAENSELQRRLADAEDDLAAARTTLRRMIRRTWRAREPAPAGGPAS